MSLEGGAVMKRRDSCSSAFGVTASPTSPGGDSTVSALHFDVSTPSHGGKARPASVLGPAAWTWGWGEFGRLGHGDTVSCLEPAALSHDAVAGAVLIACGGHHSVAVTPDGEVLAWGWGSEGQLGLSGSSDQLTPAVVRSLGGHRITFAACGYYHTVVISDGGALFAWGKGSSGQLGTGDVLSAASPRPITALRQQEVVHVSCGMAHTLAVTVSGALYAWGQGADGQLGLGEADEGGETVLSPVCVDALSDVPLSQTACGARHSLAVSREGGLFAFGLADDGRLGFGLGDGEEPEGARRLPLQARLGSGAHVRSVAAGGHHSVIVLEDGEVLTSGWGSYGQLGHGDSKASTPTPKLQTPNPNPQDGEDGEVLTCGRGSYGQLGHGDLKSRGVATSVGALKGVVVVKVACGDTHTLALAITGEVYSWGAGEDGQLGLGGNSDSSTPSRVPPRAFPCFFLYYSRYRS
ncbi:regulator of chromosome condensation 1/beta-lactamase-inhibitor protein II [Baffinella frigidus]|nr:regulator of chromosome condensation 1/beta-lactamase-inhibitor protein II [Cryptophyta sp. CCMP2293]